MNSEPITQTSFFRAVFNKIKNFASAHKTLSILIAVGLVFVAHSAYTTIFAAPKVASYVLGTVEKGSIIASVSGSGQVEATSTIELKAKSSGTITAVNVKSGQHVRKGQTLFALDAQDAQKNLRDAELNLQIAKRNYEDTTASQELSLKNALLALNSDTTAVPDDNNTNTNIVSLSGSYNVATQGRYILEAYSCEGIVCVKYSGMETGTFPIDINVPKLLGTRGLYVTFTALPKAQEKWYVDVPSPSSSSYLSNIRSYTEKQESAKETIQAAQESVTQKENALADAKQAMADYYVTAPFNGIVANIVGKVGDTASGTLATIITEQKVAEISLNEVDVARVSLGQKATLTFDAIPELSIAGSVAEIDSIGTVNQGVVTYIVKVTLDTDDTRIKTGMSVSAAIITDSKQDILIVPNGAVKAQGAESYVEVFDTIPTTPSSSGEGVVSTIPPRRLSVETGISNDTMTEIISGLTEGDTFVSRTITTTTAAKTTATAPSLFGSPTGGSRAGGNNVKFQAR